MVNGNINIADYIPHSPDRIGMRSLSQIMGEGERKTRKRITEARIAGEIIASDDRGYYIPTDVQEIESYYLRHWKRAITAFRSIKAVRKTLKAAGVDMAQIEGRKHRKAGT